MKKVSVRGVIFDLDGTVFDNEGEWEAAFRVVMDNGHLTIDNGGRNGWVHEPGIGIGPNWRKLIPHDPAKIEKLTLETCKVYQEQFASLRVRDGLLDLVEKIKEKGLLTGLATGSSWNMVERELEELNLYLAFDVTTTGEEVLVQKPDPEIYLLTAGKLELDPTECVVIEDAVAGVQAAVEAGCRVVGIKSEYASEEMLKNAGCEWVVESLEEVADLILVDEGSIL